MFIPHDSAQLYTVEFGQGRRSLLAHGGWTGSWEIWAGPFQHLSKTWRTVAYDHRGTGVTLGPVEAITIENMVSDLFAVMDRLELENCVLAAESAGAMVAVTAALQRPERFTGLVLVDALLYGTKDEGSARFTSGLKTNFSETIGQFVEACVPASEPNSTEIRSWGRKILARATPESAVRLMECTYGIDLRQRLAEIQLPTLLLHGDCDMIVPPGDSERAASQIRNSRLHILGGAGHVPTMTRPREVAKEINWYFMQ